MSDHIYKVEEEGLTSLAIYGKDGTRLIGVPTIESWARDAIRKTADALNSGEITEGEAHEWCTDTYNDLKTAALGEYYG